MNILPVYAAPVEGEGVPGALELGVGKVNATMVLTEFLATRLAKEEALPEGILLFGVAGAYPARHCKRSVDDCLEPQQLSLIARDRLADDGSLGAKGFLDLNAMGFDGAEPIAADSLLMDRATGLLGPLPRVEGATVSTCSGTEAQSSLMAQRTVALVETMEGAAVAQVCRRFSIPLLHLRCISNFTGDKSRAQWCLRPAAQRVRAAVLRLLSEAR